MSETYRGDSYWANKDDSQTAGRCHGCRLIFIWKAGSNRRLRQAFCSQCGQKLSQTCASNVKRKTARLYPGDPRFTE